MQYSSSMTWLRRGQKSIPYEKEYLTKFVLKIDLQRKEHYKPTEGRPAKLAFSLDIFH